MSGKQQAVVGCKATEFGVHGLLFAIPCLLLLLSVLGKLVLLSTTPLSGFEWWKEVASLQVALFFALWLVSGVLRHHARRAGIGLFIVFFMISFLQFIAGSQDCGCFGAAKIDPGITAGADLIAITCLLMTGQKEVRNYSFRDTTIAAYLIVLCQIVTMLPVLSFSPSRVDGDGMLVGSADVVILEPEDWIGRPLPIRRFLINSMQEPEFLALEKIVLVHEGCPACADLIRRAALVGAKRELFVGIPPFDVKPVDVFDITWNELESSKRWFVRTPVTLYLRKGIVTGVEL